MSKTPFAFIAIMLIGASTVALAEQCLGYDQEINLVGTLVRKTFPEQPNYESIENGDAAATYFFISLPTAFCVSPGPDEGSPSVARVAKVQLMFTGETDSYKALHPYLGKKVMCRGHLWPQQTGHHHSQVLLAEAICKPTKSL